MRTSLDVSELRAVQRDLESVGSRSRAAVKPVLRESGRVVRDLARSKIQGFMSGKSAIKHYPRAITHQAVEGGMAVEVGPERAKKQGGMGAAIEFGSSKAGPFPHLNPAAEEHLPVMQSKIIQAVTDRLWR